MDRPVQKRLCLEDTTIEAAQEVLAGSPTGVLLHQDELSGWFGSMDKYSGGNRGPTSCPNTVASSPGPAAVVWKIS